MNEWKKTDEELPCEDDIVSTKIEDEHGIRNESNLRRIGNLWFTEDYKMYVYYTPTHWKKLDPNSH